MTETDRSVSKGQRVALALVVLACALFALRGVRKALRPKGSDFTIYYEAAQAAREGTDPNAVEGYIYLPTFAVLTGA